ncbi:hypothetical protein [Methylophaga nitratireducenticrescens]|uniref:Uncharacterized protein n=1 Tax=Methylophaga nitratireducenticrescens TaxID=754476 RepID=I1XJX5_METNJ|nr:hypothetical protein [Methylophaga nitratireducenticrescens]AFI84694.1 hypothetical protein Q7A_1876 [Methylophaga nitratireducenticrescens]AUZ84704.1 hypothetical protein CDW43_08975 [Methylophaga nitratireducenticrescens]
MKNSQHPLFALIISLSGCSVMPHINCEKAQKVSVGMSEKEVVRLMGDPYVVQINMQNGKHEKVFGWQDQESIAASKNLLRVKVSTDGHISEVSGNCGE